MNNPPGGNYFVPGPPPTGPYEFMYVKPQPNTVYKPQGILMLPQQDNYSYLSSPDQTIERTFLYLAVFGERKDLIDRSRVYRIELKYVAKFRYDKQGAYIGDPPNRLRFVVDDPTLLIGVQRDWYPLE